MHGSPSTFQQMSQWQRTPVVAALSPRKGEVIEPAKYVVMQIAR
jgi:hypothetical protein